MAKQNGRPPGQLRAAGYCRTSGEGQRDNTSLPRQRESIETLCKQNGWALVRHYTDESKSGKKVEGRDEFQEMLRDAAQGQFDVVVVFDISRFARDGFDIMGNARLLKRSFGIDVVDSKGQFDTRESRNTLANFLHAGISEHERLTIMERTIGGRIYKARQGMLWTGIAPTGRGFRKTGDNTGEWFITERGEKLRELLKRYAAGESLKVLIRQYGFRSPKYVTEAVNGGQLSGTYVARFHAPEINIVDLKVPVAAVPPVITPELERRVRERMAHNRTWNNKECLRKYLLSGFIRCGNCGAAVSGATYSHYKYYRHHTDSGCVEKGCTFRGVHADLVEAHVLDYLYRAFLDKPAFDAAVQRSLPSTADINKLRKEAARIASRLTGVEKAIQNLVNAVARGADVGLLIGKQEDLKSERESLKVQQADIEAKLAALPDPDEVAGQATKLRLILVQKHKGKDWRKLPFDDVRAFLRYLFGDNTKKTGHGVFVTKTGAGWEVSFKGNMEFDCTLTGPNLRPISEAEKHATEAANAALRSTYQAGVTVANLRRKAAFANLNATTGGSDKVIKPAFALPFAASLLISAAQYAAMKLPVLDRAPRR